MPFLTGCSNEKPVIDELNHSFLVPQFKNIVLSGELTPNVPLERESTISSVGNKITIDGAQVDGDGFIIDLDTKHISKKFPDHNTGFSAEDLAKDICMQIEYSMNKYSKNGDIKTATALMDTKNKIEKCFISKTYPNNLSPLDNTIIIKSKETGFNTVEIKINKDSVIIQNVHDTLGDKPFKELKYVYSAKYGVTYGLNIDGFSNISNSNTGALLHYLETTEKFLETLPKESAQIKITKEIIRKNSGYISPSKKTNSINILDIFLIYGAYKLIKGK